MRSNLLGARVQIPDVQKRPHCGLGVVLLFFLKNHQLAIQGATLHMDHLETRWAFGVFFELVPLWGLSAHIFKGLLEPEFSQPGEDFVCP